MSNEAAVAQHARTTSPIPLGSAAGPLGYLALGLTLLAFGLLGTGVLSGAGVKDAGSLALFVGGLTLFIAGLLEFRGGSAATGTAFAGLGAFWVAWAQAAPSGKDAAGLFLILWALLALSLTAAHWLGGTLVRGVYALFTIALVLLAVGTLAGNDTLGKVAGWVAAAAGVLAWYSATSALAGGSWGRVGLPVR
ncbi:succinate-acetate transporter protein [Streptacidiphilus sp. MAP12-16]|uniref:acetate uptake transporter n=1 Tax=Streptacidiphilus sp. MAP12-16 TaxID=3156300 RepID=UPI00351807DF